MTYDDSINTVVRSLAGKSDDYLAARDVAEINLACAAGLPGSEGLDIPSCLEKLNWWAALIEGATRRMMPMFLGNPAEFDHSEAYFRILVLVTVLQRNLGIQYDPASIKGPTDCSDSRTLFLHGVLSGYGGTCASLPILYVALGRRLGYPLKLVGAKQHLLVRWDGPDGERFNIECTSRGLLTNPDEYYHRWPVPLTEEDIREGYYLYSLSPRQELACFLAARGHCLRDIVEFAAACEAFALASRLSPRDPNYRGFSAIARVLCHEHDGSAHYDLTPGSQCDWVVEEGRRRSQGPWEAWAVPIAREELQRITALQNRKRAGLFQLTK
jgi:hypothetical protein